MSWILIGNSVIKWGSSIKSIPVPVSAEVTNADPDKVVITFDQALNETSIPETTCFTLAGKTISDVDISGTGVILTITEEYLYGETGIVVDYTKPDTNMIKALLGRGQTVSFTGQTVTNNALYAMGLTATGTGAGVTTLVMTSSSPITLTLTGTARFYSDAGGTLNESTTQIISGGTTFYLKCPSGTASMRFSDITKITKWGQIGSGGMASPVNSALLTVDQSKMVSLSEIQLGSSATFVTFESIDFPVSCTQFVLYNNDLSWNYSGVLHGGITKLTLNGFAINWTGLNVGDTGNFTVFALTNYRTNKMSSADMVTFLTNLTNRIGGLPATITINDYADYASPPQAVIDAVDALKLAKSITTVNLGA